MVNALINQQSHSLRWLDALVFILADVQAGVGPFLAIYLQASRHWDAASIGVALSISSIAAPLAQMPAGALVDQSHHKRALIAVASSLIGLSSACVVLIPSKLGIYVTQSVIGVSSAIFIPAIAAISLGIVGTAKLDRRIARNESLNHAGNVISAGVMGLVGYALGRNWIFFFVGFLSVLSIVCVLQIYARDIDDNQARHGISLNSTDRSSKNIKAVFTNYGLLVFLLSVTLFHFANAAMLPLVGQRLAAGHPRKSSLWMAACIITAQVVMIPIAALSGRLAGSWGRKRTFLAAMCVLPIRGVLYTLTDNPLCLVTVQILDGVGAAAFGVISVLVVSDLTRNTGRFNFALGTVLGAAGLGAAISNILAGDIANKAGYNFAFLFLSTIAAIAIVIFWCFMPETLPNKEKSK